MLSSCTRFYWNSLNTADHWMEETRKETELNQTSFCAAYSRIWVLFVAHKTQCPQIYNKLTRIDKDGR